MKKTLLAIMILAACGEMFAAFFIPETSPRTIKTSPLEPGEAAVVRETSRQTATLYVGEEAGAFRRVTDPTTIRGYRVEDVPEAEVAVYADNAIWSNQAWYVVGATATGSVTFVTRGGEPIEDFKAGQEVGPTGAMDFETGIIREECEGAQLKYTMIPRHSVWCCISNVVIRRVAFGDRRVVNDLSETSYEFRDEYGEFELSRLRNWATHLYDGNRGADWSKYKATSRVDLDGKPLRFDAHGRYSLRNDSHTNLVLLAGGNPAMTVAFHGMNTDVDSFHVTSFSNRNGTVTIDFMIDADGYNPAYVGVNAKDDLTDEWTAMLPGEYTVSGYKVTIPNQSGFAKFYQLTYNGAAVTEMLEVRFRGNVIVEDALIVNGTNYIETISALNRRISALESQLVGLENALHAINTGN